MICATTSVSRTMCAASRIATSRRCQACGFPHRFRPTTRTRSKSFACNAAAQALRGGVSVFTPELTENQPRANITGTQDVEGFDGQGHFDGECHRTHLPLCRFDYT